MIENRFPHSSGSFECGKRQTKFLVCARASGWFHFGKAPRHRGYPPSPHPPRSRAWRGFCKNGLQNIERVGVRGQNIDFKDLTSFFEPTEQTAFALAIFYFPDFWRKVRCHNRPVEISGSHSITWAAVRDRSSQSHRINCSAQIAGRWSHSHEDKDRCRTIRLGSSGCRPTNRQG